MWDILVLTYFGFYAILLLTIVALWKSLPKAFVSDGITKPVSIIIPARNEEQNIEALIRDILQQNYLETAYEIIVVNDHSTDDTLEIVNKLQEQYNNVRIINLKDKEGKKHAIDAGINASNFDLIITTDADCKVGSNWISSLVNCFVKNNSDLGFGLVSMVEGNSTISKMISLEQASLVGSGAAFWKLGSPIMANGANLIFKKEAYLNVNGFEGNFEIPSGDDIFLLSKFLKKGYSTGFIHSPESIVFTALPGSLHEFLNQRRRWAGKWRKSGQWSIILIATLVFLLNSFWILFLFATLFSKITLAYFLLGTTSKVTLDLIFLYDVNRRLKRKFSFIPFILLEFIYPFYVVFFGLVSNFGGYTWKGRHY